MRYYAIIPISYMHEFEFDHVIQTIETVRKNNNNSKFIVSWDSNEILPYIQTLKTLDDSIQILCQADIYEVTNNNEWTIEFVI